MCELLIRVVDKVNVGDPIMDSKCMKRGDVVVVTPNDWPWSAIEQTNPIWRIIKLPNVTELEASAFLAPELPTDPANPSPYLRPRGFYLDVGLGALPKSLKDYLADATRAVPSYTSTVTWSTVSGWKKTKTAI